MFRNAISLVATIACSIFIAVPDSSADVLLDDFSSGAHNLTTAPFNGASSAQYDAQTVTTGAAGPLRLIDHTVGNETGGSLQTQLIGGELDVAVTTASNAGFLHGIFQDVTGIPLSGPGNVDSTNLVPLNPLLDLSGEVSLELDYTYSGPMFTTVIQFFAFGDPLSQTVFDQSGIFLLEPGSDTLSIDIATLFVNVDPAQIGSIGFTFVTFSDCDVQFQRLEAVGGTTTDDTTTADTFTIERGSLVSGTVADTQSSDDSRFIIARQPGLSRAAPVSVVFDGTLPTDAPMDLNITVETRASIQRINQTTALWNWNTQQFDNVDVTQILQSDRTLTTAAPGNHLNYVEPGTGNVRMRFRLTPAPRAVAGRGWEFEIDHLFWE